MSHGAFQAVDLLDIRVYDGLQAVKFLLPFINPAPGNQLFRDAFVAFHQSLRPGRNDILPRDRRFDRGTAKGADPLVQAVYKTGGAARFSQ